MFCREKLIFPLNWGIHGFGKLCPKGLDTLEIKCFCGALGSRCGGKVRDHVGQGYGKISQCLFTTVFQCRDSLPKGVLRSRVRMRSSRVRMRNVRVFSLSYSTDLLPGYGRGLSHSPDITSHVHNQSPNILLPTGRVERKLILSPNVGFHTLLAHRWSWGFGETQASVFAQRALPSRGGGSYENATRVAGPANSG